MTGHYPEQKATSCRSTGCQRQGQRLRQTSGMSMPGLIRRCGLLDERGSFKGRQVERQEIETDLGHADAQVDEKVWARDLQHGAVPNDAPLVQRHWPDVGRRRADLPAEGRVVLRRGQHLPVLLQRGNHNLHAGSHQIIHLTWPSLPGVVGYRAY